MKNKEDREKTIRRKSILAGMRDAGKWPIDEDPDGIGLDFSGDVGIGAD